MTGTFPVSTDFTGLIDVVNGENGLPNCHGNCLLPYILAAAVKDELYPAASTAPAISRARAGHGWTSLCSTHGI